LIALLAEIGLNDTVSTRGELAARTGGAAPTVFCLAVAAAAVTWVGRVTRLTGLNAAIAAGELCFALLAWYTEVTRLLGFAIVGATGTALGLPLIAHLPRIHFTIAANETNRALAARCRARMIGLDLANAVTAVTR
jgi:hypothetical protein